MRYFLVILSLLFFASCKHKQPQPFPTRNTYFFPNGADVCYLLPVISDNPIKLGTPMALPLADCPSGTLGIAYSDVPAVRDWVIDLQDNKKGVLNDLYENLGMVLSKHSQPD